MSTASSKKIHNTLSIIAVGLLVGFSIQFARAWTNPTAAPPGGVVPEAPITTSATDQVKLGGLGLGGGLFVGQKAQVVGDFMLGNSNEACIPAKQGSLRYNAVVKIPEYCDGAAWKTLAGGAKVASGFVVPPWPGSGRSLSGEGWISANDARVRGSGIYGRCKYIDYASSGFSQTPHILVSVGTESVYSNPGDYTSDRSTVTYTKATNSGMYICGGDSGINESNFAFVPSIYWMAIEATSVSAGASATTGEIEESGGTSSSPTAGGLSWVTFEGEGTPSIKAKSSNIARVQNFVYGGSTVGRYEVVFDPPMPDTNYAFTATPSGTSSDFNAYTCGYRNKTTTSIQFSICNETGSRAIDVPDVSVVVVR